MPRWVERATTEGARRSSGADELDASAGERERLSGLDDNAQHGIELGGMLRLQQGLALVIGLNGVLRVMALQDHDAAFGVPSEAHGAHPELVLDGCGEWIDILDDPSIGVGRLKVGKIIKQVGNPVGESAHLLLFQ